MTEEHAVDLFAQDITAKTDRLASRLLQREESGTVAQRIGPRKMTDLSPRNPHGHGIRVVPVVQLRMEDRYGRDADALRCVADDGAQALLVVGLADHPQRLSPAEDHWILTWSLRMSVVTTEHDSE